MKIFLFCVLLPFGYLFIFEYLTYLLHKHVMHGFGWVWHDSHHQNPGGGIEKNDYYAVCFAIIAMGLFYLSTFEKNGLWILSIAIGLTAYGVLYFLVHDVLIHRRWPNALYRKIQSPYIKRLIRAHAIHHKLKTKHGNEAFGFLYAPKKYRYPTENLETLKSKLQEVQ